MLQIARMPIYGTSKVILRLVSPRPLVLGAQKSLVAQPYTVLDLV